MLVDLVQTTTRDGCRLDGIWQSSPQSPRGSSSLDAVCFVHGTGINFYSSTLFDDLARHDLQMGCPVLRVNTRARPDEPYHFLRFIARVHCPTLVALGGGEVAANMAFRGLPEEVEPLAAKNAGMRLEIVAGADHFYTGLRGILSARIGAWLLATFPLTG